MAREVTAALTVDQNENADWTFAKGPPAPPDTSLRLLAGEFGENLKEIAGLEEKLNTVFMALGVDDVEDLKSAVGTELESALVANGLYSTFRNTLRKFTFGASKALGDFREPQFSALLLGGGDDESEASTKGERKFTEGGSKISQFLQSDLAYARFDFTAEVKAMLLDALGLTNKEQGVSKALTIVFMYHVVVFKIVYLDTKLKERYAFLLAGMRASVTITSWRNAIKDGWTNRRKGRIVGGFTFHPVEVEENQGFDELKRALGHKLVNTDENAQRFFPITNLDFSTQGLINAVELNALATPLPLSSCSISSRSSPHSCCSSTNSPVPKPNLPDQSSPMTTVTMPAAAFPQAMQPNTMNSDSPALGTANKPRPSKPEVPKFSGNNMSPAAVQKFLGPRGASQPMRLANKDTLWNNTRLRRAAA